MILSDTKDVKILKYFFTARLDSDFSRKNGPSNQYLIYILTMLMIIKVRRCRARDLFGSQIPVATVRFAEQINGLVSI